MWLIVFFDLPVKTKPERRAATGFRRFLLQDGYTMIQFSVYARVCNEPEGVEKHKKRIVQNLPEKGHIRALIITDQQYGRIQLFLGEKTARERKNNDKQLTLF